MALPMEKLYKNCIARYRMRLIAGNEGMNNLVKWVHIVEDEEVPAFLHGGELVFTAGIRSKIAKDWLRTFAENLYQAGASVFVVNIGPYIQEVPEDVIAYCNEVSMPLFTIPWETHMVDMTREFCQRIIHSETIEDSISTTIKNILFQIGDLETQILQME